MLVGGGGGGGGGEGEAFDTILPGVKQSSLWGDRPDVCLT